MESHVNGFLSYLVIEKNTSPNTNKKYRYECENFCSYIKEKFGIENPDRIKLSHIRDYLAHVTQATDLMPASIANKIAVIKSFFNYLHESAITSSNPAKKLKKPKVPERAPKFLNEIELTKLLSSPDRVKRSRCKKHKVHDKAILTLLSNTGIRRSELLNLDWSDVNLGNKYLVVRQSKNKIDRTIPLNTKTAELLEAYLAQRLPLENNALFIGEQGRRLSVNSLILLFKKYIKLAGLDGKGYTIHTLRHLLQDSLKKR